MKDKKKPKGTKAKVQAYKKRIAYIGHTIIVAILVSIIAVSSFFLYSMLFSPSEQTPISQFKPDNSDSQLKAAIVDHLSLTCPNQTFIQTATDTLKQAGYTVDYYPGEQVTVEFYRNLPTYAYKLIILRVHSAAASYEEKEFKEAPVCLFTSEPYSKTKHVYEQLTDQLVIASYTMPEPPYYFAIMPKFVTSSVNGKFDNTVIIMMGCEGLHNEKMAEALIEKGAKVYISWNEMISASHTDQTTTHLLKHLITENQTIRQSVEKTMKEVGADPDFKNLLSYHPLEVGDQTIKNINSES